MPCDQVVVGSEAMAPTEIGGTQLMLSGTDMNRTLGEHRQHHIGTIVAIKDRHVVFVEAIASNPALIEADG